MVRAWLLHELWCVGHNKTYLDLVILCCEKYHNERFHVCAYVVRARKRVNEEGHIQKQREINNLL